MATVGTRNVTAASSTAAKTAFPAPCWHRNSRVTVALPKRNNGCRGRLRGSQLLVRAVTLQGTRGASGIDVGGFRPTSPKAWEIISTTLKQNNVKMLSPQELVFQQEQGAMVLDIRPPQEFEDGHIPNSINIPLYRPITGWDTRKFLRRAGFAFFGIFNGTEANPDFDAEVLEALSTNSKGAILVCNMGGSLDPSGPSVFGMQSRSLMAAYEVIQAGYSRVSVLKGGFNDWAKAGRPVEP